MHDGQTSIPNSTIVLIESGVNTRTINNNNENILIAPSTQQLLFADGTTATVSAATAAAVTTVANVLRSNNTIIIDDNNGGVVINNNNNNVTVSSVSVVHSATANTMSMLEHLSGDNLYVDCSQSQLTTSTASTAPVLVSVSSASAVGAAVIQQQQHAGSPADQTYSNEVIDIDMKDGSFIDDDETSQGM